PTRSSRIEPEPPLPVEAVDLVDDAVDIVSELSALVLDLFVESEQFLDRVAGTRQRIDDKAARLEPGEYARLRVLGNLAHLTVGIGEEMQRPRRGHARILLAQRAGGRISWVCEYLITSFRLPLVERQEVVLGHIDLPADFADREQVLSFE